MYKRGDIAHYPTKGHTYPWCDMVVIADQTQPHWVEVMWVLSDRAAPWNKYKAPPHKMELHPDPESVLAKYVAWEMSRIAKDGRP